MALSVLDFITGRKQKIQSAALTAWQRYRELLDKFADGLDVDYDYGDQILDEAGKSESELQRDVATLTERRRLAKELAAGQNAEQTMRAAESEGESLVAQLREFESKIVPKIQAARERYKTAELQVLQTSNAATRLHATVMDPELLERENALVKEHRELNFAIHDIDEQIKSLQLPYYEGQVDFLQKHPKDKWLKPGDLQRYPAELASRTDARNRLLGRRAPLVERVAEIELERAQIEKQKLVP